MNSQPNLESIWAKKRQQKQISTVIFILIAIYTFTFANYLISFIICGLLMISVLTYHYWIDFGWISELEYDPISAVVE